MTGKKSRERCSSRSPSPSPAPYGFKPSLFTKHASLEQSTSGHGNESSEQSAYNRRNASAERSTSGTRKTSKSKKRHRSRSSSSSDSESNSSSSCSSKDNSSAKSKRKKHKKSEKKKRKKEKKKLKKKLKKEKRKLKKAAKEVSAISAATVTQSSKDLKPEDDKSKKEDDEDRLLLDRAKAMAPMTKEEWEKRQSVIRKVYDEETGRQRLIKGDGEVLEEIVSRDRHREINKQASRGDGAFFQSTIASKILERK